VGSAPTYGACDKQSGARAVREWHEAGGVIAVEHHLCTAPVSYLSRRSCGCIKREATTVKDERTRPGLFYVMFYYVSVNFVYIKMFASSCFHPS